MFASWFEAEAAVHVVFIATEPSSTAPPSEPPEMVTDFVMVNGSWSAGRSYRPSPRMQVPPAGAIETHFCKVVNAEARLFPSALSEPLKLT